MSAFDLYCARNGHLLLGSRSPSRQTLLLNAARAMAGALVVLAANVESDVPLLVLAALLGLQLLLAPLRLFEISRVMAGVGWCVLVLLAGLVHLGFVPSEALRGAVNAGWVVFVIAAAATFATEQGVAQAAERMVGATIIGGAGLLSLLAARAVAPGLLGDLPELITAVALVMGAMLIAGGVAAAATTGLARGVRISDKRVDPWRTLPRTPHAPSIREPLLPLRPEFAPSDGLARIAFAVTFTLAKVARLAVGTLNAALDLLWAAGHALSVALTRTANSLHRGGVRLSRMLAAATAATGKLLARVVSEGSSSASRSGRSLLVSAAALGTAAALAVLAAASYADYLSGGGLGKAGLTALTGTGACVALVTVWGALTRCAWSEVRAAAGRLLQDAGPNLLVVTVAVAWSVGLLGLLGVGPVQPGWLILAGTGLLVAITLFEGRHRRRVEPMVSDIPTAGDPTRGTPLADEPIPAHTRRRRFRSRGQASDVEVKIGAVGESDVRRDEPAPR